jgi:hypothetical protein
MGIGAQKVLMKCIVRMKEREFDKRMISFRSRHMCDPREGKGKRTRN